MATENGIKNRKARLKYFSGARLFIWIKGNIIFMKRLRLKKYDMTFMYIPVLILSVLSVIMYIVRLFFPKTANAVFFVLTAAVLCFFIAARIRLKILKAVLILLAISFCAVYFILGNSFFELAAQKFGNTSPSFGFFDFLFNTAGLYDFQTLVFETSYGGARLVDNMLVCGVVNIVKANPQSDLVYFLSGKTVFMFALCGILLSEKKNFKANLLICALTLISGNLTPVLILLLFTSPAVYFLALLINYFSYIVSEVFEVKGAFTVSPSIFEIIFHSQNVINVFAVGFLFCAASFFVSRLVRERKK